MSHPTDGNSWYRVETAACFEGENEVMGEAANWRRLGTGQRGNGFKPQFDTNLAPSIATD